VAGRTRERRYSTHEGAADAEYVKVHAQEPDERSIPANAWSMTT
jgi:hypothetical protein